MSKIKKALQRIQVRAFRLKFALTALLASAVATCYAQTPAQIGTSISGASTTVNGIFGPVSTLIMAVGAIVGLAGGIRVYTKWHNGDQDVQKHLVGWMGACIFLLLIGGVLKTMFG